MTISIPDDILRAAGLTERDALIELACRLFDVDRLDLTAAARLSGLSRVEFESELVQRKIPPYRPTVEDFEQDIESLRRIRGSNFGRGADELK